MSERIEWEYVGSLRRSDLDPKVWICDIPFSTHGETQAAGLRLMKRHVVSEYVDPWFRHRWLREDDDRWVIEIAEPTTKKD